MQRFVAPAGFGKTTLALALAREGEAPARCDCLRIGTPVELMRSVLEAVGESLAPSDRLAIADTFIALGNDEAAWERYTRRILHAKTQPTLIIFDNGEALSIAPASCAPWNE